MIDRIVTTLAQRLESCFAGIGDQRLHIGMVDLDADRAGKLARREHIRHVLALVDGHHVGRRPVLGDVLVA